MLQRRGPLGGGGTIGLASKQELQDLLIWPHLLSPPTRFEKTAYYPITTLGNQYLPWRLTVEPGGRKLMVWCPKHPMFWTVPIDLAAPPNFEHWTGVHGVTSVDVHKGVFAATGGPVLGSNLRLGEIVIPRRAGDDASPGPALSLASPPSSGSDQEELIICGSRLNVVLAFHGTPDPNHTQAVLWRLPGDPLEGQQKKVFATRFGEHVVMNDGRTFLYIYSSGPRLTLYTIEGEHASFHGPFDYDLPDVIWRRILCVLADGSIIMHEEYYTTAHQSHLVFCTIDGQRRLTERWRYIDHTLREDHNILAATIINRHWLVIVSQQFDLDSRGCMIFHLSMHVHHVDTGEHLRTFTKQHKFGELESVLFHDNVLYILLMRESTDDPIPRIVRWSIM